MSAVTSASQHPSFVQNTVPQPIQLDCRFPAEWRGIKQSEVGVYSIGRNPKVTVQADVLLSCDLAHGAFKSDPQIAFTFHAAASYVIQTINENTSMKDQDGYIPVRFSDNGIDTELAAALRNIPTQRPGLMPEPPKDVKYPVCPTSNTCWMGAILSMLHETGTIQTFGMLGNEYVVKL